MVIDPERLTSLRDEYSLISYGPRCFAIILCDRPQHSKLVSFTENVNKFNPHRAVLEALQLYSDHTSQPFAVLELKPETSTVQSYFTYLIVLLSRRLPVWIHIWDVFEHDALRRDFDVPSEMDAELSINRLWIKSGTVYLLRNGYTADNPHGEFVSEITLEEAIGGLRASKAVKCESLTSQVDAFMKESLNHLLEHVLDIENVLIPNNLVNIVLHHPSWITRPGLDDFDPTQILWDALPSLSSEKTAFTMVVSDIPEDHSFDGLFPKSLSPAQWVALSIMNNANNEFSRAKGDVEKTSHLNSLLDQEFPEDCFLSTFLSNQLCNLGLFSDRTKVKAVKGEPKDLTLKGNQPWCVLKSSDREKYLEMQRQNWKMGDDQENDKNDLDNDKPAKEHSSSFFTGLEDTAEFNSQFAQSDIFRELAAAIEDPELLGQAQALTEEDLRKTEDLEEFDDFVEYYAKHFLGYDDEDLEKHRIKDQDNSQPSATGSGNTPYDWAKYNDESDYESESSDEDAMSI